ncbi:hypothetical protein CVT26_010863 [Gymnopilus dilepis]|uniref:Uncharacterized protein n=1 Tax=Gymnopilus dilepis TaxID=231916 RepID=A0A409WSM3_9AGAR|nr:hypothetical protein CVT26_010863 [Gymnopilus dilepis]
MDWDREKFGPLIETPSSRYRMAVTAADVNRPIDVSAGKAWKIDGEVFFSPNSLRQVRIPPDLAQSVYLRKTSEEDVRDLHQPLWWSERTAYLAFLPLAPDFSFPFTALFGATFREGRMTVLDPSTILRWKKLENFLIEVLNDLRDHYGFPKPEPVMITAVSTGAAFKNIREFGEKVARLQHWFAVWMAQLSHAIAAAIAMDADKQEGENAAPSWIYHLCKHGKWDQAFISGLNSSVAHFRPDFERVGVFLDILDMIKLRPHFSVDFLLRFHVPVWYRWGDAEREAARNHPEIARLAPHPDQLRSATPVTTLTALTVQSPTITPDRPWEAFFAERKRQEPFVIRSESPVQRGRRLNRSLNHPENHTTNVYIWQKGPDDTYVRTHVDKCRNASTLAEMGEKQKFYNPVFNEWDCGYDLGDPDDYDDSPILGSQPLPHNAESADSGSSILDVPTSNVTQQAISDSLPSSASTVLNMDPGVREHADSYEIEKYPVTQTLYEYFGFVVPLPIPDKYPLPPRKLLDSDIKFICRIVGVDQLDQVFVQSVLMQYCHRFFMDLGDQKASLPAADLFDLSPTNRLYVGATTRWRFIRKTGSGWFVLSLPSSTAQAPWKLAVSHPIAALLLCRLDQSLSDYELCNVLVQRGIEFHTFLPMKPVSPRPLPSLLMPVRFSDYRFTYHDYELYLQDRERLLSDPRIRRAALMRGGIIWRLASSHVGPSEVLMGPTFSALRYRQGFCTPSHNYGEIYWDDGLHETEMNALCGLVYCYTGNYIFYLCLALSNLMSIYLGRGNQQQYLSWWPLDGTWRKDVELPFWNERLEGLVQGRLRELSTGTAKPLNASEWHRRIRSASNVRRVFRNLGDASRKLLAS